MNEIDLEVLDHVGLTQLLLQDLHRHVFDGSEDFEQLHVAHCSLPQVILYLVYYLIVVLAF